MPSNGCTRSSNGGSRRRPCCHHRRPPPCCSGPCSPPDRSPCARSTAGRRWPPSRPTRSLTSPPDPLTSNPPERPSRHFPPYSRQHQGPALALICHLADGGAGPVTLTAFRRAEMWGEYLKSHAARLYDGLIRPSLSAARTLG